MFSIPRKCGLGSLARLYPSRVAQLPLRQYSDKDCSEEKPATSKCGLVLKEYPCDEKLSEPYVHKKTPRQPELISMWTIPDCEPDLCVMDLRYDMKYYRISDKRKRKYQVTWNECPQLLIKPKKVCIYEKMVKPKIKRRKRVAKSSAGEAKKCVTAAKEKCVYIKAPCCKIGRRPPKCRSAFPSLGNCEKRKAPYPSFSECKKDPFAPLPPVECRCLDLPALCDAWAILRRRIARGKQAVKGCTEA